jgi:hypothetical protein
MTLQEQRDILQAALDGKTIQYRIALRSWRNVNNPFVRFNFRSTEYRVKPEPREFYVNIYGSGSKNRIHSTRERADQQAAHTRLECIKVREVLED